VAGFSVPFQRNLVGQSLVHARQLERHRDRLPSAPADRPAPPEGTFLPERSISPRMNALARGIGEVALSLVLPAGAGLARALRQD
jgi:hypothetical protein